MLAVPIRYPQIMLCGFHHQTPICFQFYGFPIKMCNSFWDVHCSRENSCEWFPPPNSRPVVGWWAQRCWNPTPFPICGPHVVHLMTHIFNSHLCGAHHQTPKMVLGGTKKHAGTAKMGDLWKCKNENRKKKPSCGNAHVKMGIPNPDAGMARIVTSTHGSHKMGMTFDLNPLTGLSPTAHWESGYENHKKKLERELVEMRQ